MSRYVLLGVLLLSTLGGTSPAADDRPDIVLILADDLGFSDLGCYGSEITTKHIDELARHGMIFSQFYNTGRGCPSRASLLTGLYPHQTGVGHSTADWNQPGYRGNLNEECVTLAEVLGQAGYRTIMAGRWSLTRHHGRNGPKHTWPTARGFDQFLGTIHPAGSYFAPYSFCRQKEFMRPPKNCYYTNALSDYAAECIGQAVREEAPFFLYLAYTAPHWPLHAPAEDIAAYRTVYGAGWHEIRQRRFQEMLRRRILPASCRLSPWDRRIPRWETLSHRAWYERQMEVHAAQVEAMDRGIGRVLEELRLTERWENTLVMFLSDNGASAEQISRQWQGPHIPTQTEHRTSVQVGNQPTLMPGPAETYQSRAVGWAAASNAPFRLFKRFVHEGGIATPMVVHWPAVIREGFQITPEVGHVVDVMATCCEVTRISYPSHHGTQAITPTAGMSLVPVFQGKSRRRGPIYFEHEGNRAVRDDRWKLVAVHRGAWELYDMEADRSETTDLAATRPEVVERLSRMHIEWAEQSNVLPWPK